MSVFGKSQAVKVSVVEGIADIESGNPILTVSDLTKGPVGRNGDEAMRLALLENDFVRYEAWRAVADTREKHPGMPEWMADALIVVPFSK